MDERRAERFGRYEILAELGRGAMGIVYKARDPKINRVVAIKTFSLAGQPPEEEQEYRERFFREAEAAGRLSHPGIVTVFDVGEQPESRSPYIVMEFVSGQSLDQILSRDDHKLPLEIALQLAHELAEALDCAHGQGVVHRDLKPANILITEDGHAKIADFGVAKLNLASHTLAGRALGTPAYMSPEQLNGETVDGRSDLFSLGVVLYTTLTGYRPFQGNSAMTVSYKVVHCDPVAASVLDTQLPQGLDYIINRAMAKDPAQRYQRGMEMALDIQDLRDGRELWSKAKQQSPSNASVTPIGSAKARLSTKIHAWNSAVSSSAANPKPDAKASSEKLIGKMRNLYFAGALLLATTLLFAFRLSHFVSHTTAQPQPSMQSAAAQPFALAGDAAPVTREPIPAVAATGEKSGAPSRPVAADIAPHTEINKPPQLTRKVLAPRNATPTLKPEVAAPVAPATLEIEIEHRFAEAHLSIWVDGNLTYTHQLEGTDKKHLVVFHRMQGHEFHAMPIPPGHHQLRVKVVSDADTTDHSATLTGEFSSEKEATLRIIFDKHGEMNVTLD
jgi:serine/threonine-protein kinase